MAVNFQLAPGEKFEQCPYDISHRITNMRLLTHLTKCRANYKTEQAKKGKKCEMAQCRYNFTHQMNLPEREFHEQRCPDRNSIVPHIAYHSSEEFQQKLKADREREASTPNAWGNKVKTEGSRASANADSDEEDWDKDCREGFEAGYDPKIKLESDCFLYNPMGLKKAERKKFREANRLKALRKSEMEEKAQYQPQPKPVKDEKVFGGREGAVGAQAQAWGQQVPNGSQAYGQSFGHRSQDDVKPKVFSTPYGKSESPGPSTSSADVKRAPVEDYDWNEDD